MLQTDAETMVLSEGIVCSFRVIDQMASVLPICDLRCRLDHILVRTVIEIMS